MTDTAEFAPTSFFTTPASPAGEAFTYDAQTLERGKARRKWRLNVIQIPLLRFAGFALLTTVALLYDLGMYETMPWDGWGTLVAINFGYCLAAWLVMALLYGRTGRFDLTLLFLHLDVLVWLATLYHLEGAHPVLAMLLLARVGDATGFSFRRALYFNHFVLAAYLGYVTWLIRTGANQASLAEYLVIALAIYALGLYISLTALTVSRLRERSTHAVRQARDLLRRLDQKTHDLEQQAAELAIARDGAESASRTKSAFLATMSHELRTPMNGILGIAQLLQEPEMRDAERLEFAHILLESGQNLLVLLNDILDLSKIEAGKLELQYHALDPMQLVQEVITLFAENASNKKLALHNQCALPAGQRYLCDSHRLRQMLSNLVSNAIKFTKQGDIRIEARELLRTDQHALLEFAVSDTGIGIPQDKVSLLFLPFSQADSSTTRHFGGTGLGLSIVRQLALLMDGDVGAESTLGQGSRFWFRIRAHLADATPATAPLAEPVPAAQVPPQTFSGHVLVVEDIEANRKVAQKMLRQLGMRLSMAENGQQAVALITGGQTYDLVLMDVQMPVMDGLTATRHIRRWESDQARPALPIIAFTANAYEEDRKQCQAAGMNDFLSKPISLPALRQVLETWLRPAKD